MEWLIIGYIINFILIIALVCFERREPVVALAWVLGFTLFPVLGFIVFLFFGRGLKSYNSKKYELKTKNDIEYSNGLKRQLSLFNRTSENNTSIIRYLLNTNQSFYTDDNSVKIFTDAKEKYSSLLEDIRNAKESVNLLYFIIRDDNIGNELIDLLSQKARDGVEVRLLYDGIGTFFTPKKMFKPLIKNGGKVGKFLKGFNALLEINHRNHRKIAVIDGKYGYLGGMNIGDEYMGLKKLNPWRDTHIKLVGSSVFFLQERFAIDWKHATGEDISVDFKKFFTGMIDGGEIGIQLVSSGPDSKAEEIKCAMIKIISNAQKYVYIQTPYFIPDKPFMESLIVAVKSGVDVRLMLPGKPDKKAVYYTTMSYVGELLNAGVKVYLYPGFIHSKTIVADDEICTIGTTNIDIRSFQLHFEMNAFIYSNETAVECREIFENDQKECLNVTNELYRKRSVFQIMKEGFFRMFSPIM